MTRKYTVVTYAARMDISCWHVFIRAYTYYHGSPRNKETQSIAKDYEKWDKGGRKEADQPAYVRDWLNEP